MTAYKYNFNEIEKLSIEIWKAIVIMNREALRLNEKIRLDALEAIAYLVYDLENFSELFGEESLPKRYIDDLNRGIEEAYKKLNDKGYKKSDMVIIFSKIEDIEGKIKPFI
ncbi:hypothetical protein [Staphylococcus xylosus]|uniref:hypothetical protein n=1 Tax=Staphylococcus xylosus TaxID=1288 RepID=UPI003F57BFE6